MLNFKRKNKVITPETWDDICKRIASSNVKLMVEHQGVSRDLVNDLLENELKNSPKYEDITIRDEIVILSIWIKGLVKEFFNKFK